MAKTSPIINALNAGEWSPLLDGRTDIRGYSASASIMRDFIPTVQGPAVRRAGTRYVRPVKFGETTKSRLVPFIKARDDAYVIEFGNGYCRFFTNEATVLTGSPTTITGATQADPVVITSTAHGYSNDDEVFISGVAGMTELNGRWFVVGNVTANTYELRTVLGNDVDGTGYDAYTSGGTADKPYEIVSPYTSTQLDEQFGIDFIQSGDVLYITDRAGLLEPRKLSRTAPTSWAFSVLQPDNGPYLAVNSTDTTMYASAATGSVTLTASTSVFTADDVGSLIRIDQERITATAPWKSGTSYITNAYKRSEGKEYKMVSPNGTSGTTIPSHTSGVVTDGNLNWEFITAGYGVGRITAQAGTTATVDVLIPFPQTVIGSANASTLWRKGAWSEANGYPTCVTFFRERLTFGQNQSVHASVVGDFENFEIDNFGEVLTESAISVDVQSSEANRIVGLTEGNRLIVNTIGAEFTISGQAENEPFGPNNIQVLKQTSYGSADIRPVRVGESVLFLQASQRKMRSMQYEFQVDNYVAPDLSVRSPDILRSGIVQMARQEEPYQTIWAIRDSGILISFAFDQTQEVRAWARHRIAGTSAPLGAESVAVIPAADGSRDTVWLTVRRVIDGQQREYIEFLQNEYTRADDQEDAKYADSMLTYSGAATQKVVGYDHLEGLTVGVLSEGAAVADKVVSNGEVTLTEDASTKLQIGLRYKSIYQTNRIDSGAQDGTSQAKTKRITDCAFRVVNTLGGSAGPDADNLDEIPDLNYRLPVTPMGSPPDLVTGDVLLSWPSGYETDGYIRYETDAMYPTTISAIMPQITVQESR